MDPVVVWPEIEVVATRVFDNAFEVLDLASFVPTAAYNPNLHPL
jgi:hypothetical protein